MKYCITCGEKLIKDKIISYDSETGHPIFLMICPTKLCKHTNIRHDYTIIKNWFNNIIVCNKCGHKLDNIY